MAHLPTCLGVKKRLLIPPISPEGAVFLTRTLYTEPQGGGLLQVFGDLTASDTFGEYFARRSADHGATWSEPSPVFLPERLPEGTVRLGESALLRDDALHRIFRFYNHSVYPEAETFSMSVMRRMRIEYEVSTDEGVSFSQPKPLIVEGGDATQWAPRTVYGRNSLAISFCCPLVDRRGRILLPARWVPEITPETTLIVPMQVVCLIGETDAVGALRWSAGDFVTVDEECSVRGLCEPALIECADGRLLMVCRGSNAGRPDMPGRKWFTTSSDGGKTWAPVRPWSYDTGEFFFSPATGSNLLRSSRNGKIYWIGNIVPENPTGNLPRFPLCIGEVDEESLALRKDTARIIESRLPTDTPKVQLSNFHTYEDRATGELVIILPRLFENSESSLRSPAYEYRVSVPVRERGHLARSDCKNAGATPTLPSFDSLAERVCEECVDVSSAGLWSISYQTT